MSDMTIEAIGLCIPLLAVVCPLCTGGGALVTGVAGDTAKRQRLWYRREMGEEDTP